MNATDMSKGTALLHALCNRSDIDFHSTLKSRYFPKTHSDCKCIRWIIQTGADVNELNRNSILQHAVEKYATAGWSLHENLQLYNLIRHLILAGADVNTNDFSRCRQLREELRICLQHLCRETIRRWLISRWPRFSLFVTVQKIKLPQKLVSYILYHDLVNLC